MTGKLPFTEHSIRRLIRGIESAGKFVVGARADGTLIVGDRPVDTASLVPVPVHDAPASKWEDQHR